MREYDGQEVKYVDGEEYFGQVRFEYRLSLVLIVHRQLEQERHQHQEIARDEQLEQGGEHCWVLFHRLE